MTVSRAPSAAVTSFVVGSRYLPVYLALILLVVVASIWAPATLSSAGLEAIAPMGTFLAITALGQMLVIMTGGIDLSVPGTFLLAACSWSGSGSSPMNGSGSPTSPPSGSPPLIGLRERDPDRWAQAQPADRHPRGRPDRHRYRHPLLQHGRHPDPGARRLSEWATAPSSG